MIIALEGIDACGKQTQTKRLLESFDSHRISFPDYHTHAGCKIRELLESEKRDPLILQSLMLTNRMEFQWDIETYKDSASLLILDRYWLSGLVYGIYDGLSPEWLEIVHSRLVQPDLWIVLDISVDESFRRRPVREDSFESDRERLQSVSRLYQKYAAMGSLLGVPIHRIDGMQDESSVHRDIVSLIKR